MEVSIARIDCSKIQDFESLHDVFDDVFGFPPFYGRNMNAWMDCMTYLDDEDAAMSRISVGEGKVLTLELVEVAALRVSAPDVYAAIIECAGFVNFRRVDMGSPPIIAIAMDV